MGTARPYGWCSKILRCEPLREPLGPPRQPLLRPLKINAELGVGGLDE